MENLTVQFENIMLADSRPTNLSSDFSQAVIPCTLVDSSTGTDVGFLDYKHDGSASRKKICIVLNFRGSDAVKSKSGKGEPDFHGFQVEILKDRKGETLYQVTDVRSLDAKSNTVSDRFLGGTRLVAKYIGSEPRLYLESGKGETFKSTELGILESACNYLTARSLCSTRLVAKFTGSQPGIKHLAAGEDGHLVGGNMVVKAVLPISGKGVSSQKLKIGIADPESNTHLDDDDGSTSTDKGFLISENNTCHVDLSKSRRKSAGSGPLPLAPFWKVHSDARPPLSTRNRCVFDNKKTTADGMLMAIDSCGSPAVKSNADKGGSQALILKEFIIKEFIIKELIFKELISKVFKGGSEALILKELILMEFILMELISKVFKDFLRLVRNAYVHLDGRTTKESISVGNDLKSVSPTVIPIPIPVEGKTPQRSDVPSPDSESITPPEDADSQEAQRASMESLPADIVQDILCRVPAESVLGCKLVCKQWETLIRGSNFANMHLRRLLNHLDGGEDGNHYLAANVESSLFFACRFDNIDRSKTLLYHGGLSTNEKYIYSQNLKRIYHAPMHTNMISDHFVGSCNGLVCTYQLHNAILDPIYICNPLTREYVHLPQLVVKPEDVDRVLIIDGEANMFYNMACGFGYVRSTKEYKVVRIHYLDYNEGTVEVYTLGSGCGWRAIGKIPRRLNLTRRGTGTYASDAIYWISMKNEVVAFDLADEKFRLLSSVPPCLQNRKVKDRCGLVALGRRLCLYIDYKVRVEIWSLMKSSDSKHTWHMEFDINYEAVVGSGVRKLQPILLTKKGEVILLYAGSVLHCYDPKTRILKMISNQASDYSFRDVEAIAHLNTFESLEATGENSKRFRVRPRLVRTPWDDIVNELDRAALGEEIDTTRYRLGSSSINL